jgi:hypothetical protein
VFACSYLNLESIRNRMTVNEIRRLQYDLPSG